MYPIQVEESQVGRDTTPVIMTDKSTEKKMSGKSIAWNADEVLALVKSAAVVLLDSATGAQMSKA